MWQSACPDSPPFIVLDSVGETLGFERAFSAQSFGNPDGVFPGLFVRKVLGEKNVRNVLAWGSTVLFDGFREVTVGLSVVAHNLILEEETDGS